MKNKYIITYINMIGKKMTIERTYTKEELQEELNNYKNHNMKVLKVLKEVITITYEEVK